ncbi:hypothetical protein [Trueperella pyogenes]|uniref:hypothetical protein n=1 Tax=Trueperella pyogenes TaxID=1661 RepID=UPI00046B0AAD|nr:hypothetical protein [Trueperella pyogenes]
MGGRSVVIIEGKTPRQKKIKYINQFELHTVLANLELGSHLVMQMSRLVKDLPSVEPIFVKGLQLHGQRGTRAAL